MFMPPGIFLHAALLWRADTTGAASAGRFVDLDLGWQFAHQAGAWPASAEAACQWSSSLKRSVPSSEHGGVTFCTSASPAGAPEGSLRWLSSAASPRPIPRLRRHRCDWAKTRDSHGSALCTASAMRDKAAHRDQITVRRGTGLTGRWSPSGQSGRARRSGGQSRPCQAICPHFSLNPSYFAAECGSARHNP